MSPQTSGASSLSREGVEHLAGAISEGQAELLSGYAAMILEGGQRLNLLSRSGLDRVWEHIVDSAALLSFVDVDGRSVADLGSGGGLPGVVVAILRPTARVVLVESRRRKAAFLRRVRARLSLGNVEVVEDRLEHLVGVRSFDVVASRALGNIEETLRSSLQLVAPGGRLVLFKGPKWKEEAARATEIALEMGGGIVRAEEIALPGLDRATVFVEFHVKRTT